MATTQLHPNALPGKPYSFVAKILPYTGGVVCFYSEASAKPSFASESTAKPSFASEAVSKPSFSGESTEVCS